MQSPPHFTGSILQTVAMYSSTRIDFECVFYGFAFREHQSALSLFFYDKRTSKAILSVLRDKLGEIPGDRRSHRGTENTGSRKAMKRVEQMKFKSGVQLHDATMQHLAEVTKAHSHPMDKVMYWQYQSRAVTGRSTALSGAMTRIAPEEYHSLVAADRYIQYMTRSVLHRVGRCAKMPEPQRKYARCASMNVIDESRTPCIFFHMLSFEPLMRVLRCFAEAPLHLHGIQELTSDVARTTRCRCSSTTHGCRTMETTQRRCRGSSRAQNGRGKMASTHGDERIAKDHTRALKSI